MNQLAFLFLTMGLLGSGFAQEKGVAWKPHVFKAPTKALYCEVGPRPKIATGAQAELCDPASKIRLLLCSTERWCEAKWSPDSRFLAIENHFDGQGSELLIFDVLRSSSGKIFTVRAYLSPGEDGALGADWTLVRWDLKNGAVLIKRSRTMKATRAQLDAPKVDESYFKVPIR